MNGKYYCSAMLTTMMLWISLSAQTNPLPSGKKTVQFTCTLNGVVYTSDQLQPFQMGRGNSEFIMGQNQDLLAYERKEAPGSSYSSMPGPGYVQMTTTVKDEDAVSIVLGLAAPFPKDSGKWLKVSLSIKGIPRGSLKKLPRGEGDGAPFFHKM